MSELFQRLVSQGQQSQEAPTDGGIMEAPSTPEPQEAGWMESIGSGLVAGAMTAGTETYQTIMDGVDTLQGLDPKSRPKSQFEEQVEDVQERTDNLNTTATITSDLAQFTTGLLGLKGVLKAGSKLITKNGTKLVTSKAGRVGTEVAQAATAGAVVFDPHEDRLSNLIEQYPSLQNPVSAYLAADPEDSVAEGRFKAALESVAMDAALMPVFMLTTKAFKAIKRGDADEASTVIDELELLDKPLDPDAPRLSLDETFDEGLVSPEAQGLKDDLVAQEAQRVGATGETFEQVPTVAKGLPAKDTPKPKQRVEVTPEDVVAVKEATSEEVQNLIRHGGREGYAQATGEPIVRQANLPWHKLNAPEDVEAFIGQTADRLKSQLDAKKGGDVLTDAQVGKTVKAYAKLFGEDADLLMADLAQAGEQANAMTAKMEAAYLVSNRMFMDAYDLSIKIERGDLKDFGGSTEEATESLKDMIAAAADTLGSANAIRAAGGRTVRRNRSEFGVKDADLENLAKLSSDSLMKAIRKTEGDPQKIAELVKPRFWEKLNSDAQGLLVNNLLWLYPTHLVNTVTNAYMVLARPTEKLVGAAILGKPRSVVARRAAKEFAYTYHALGDAWAAGIDAFTKGDSTLSPFTDEFFEAGRSNTIDLADPTAPKPQWSKVSSIESLTENLYLAAQRNKRDVAITLSLPTRALGGMDEFFKTLRYRAVVQAEASVRAMDAGLEGEAYSDFMKKMLDDAFDERGRALDDEALYDAQVSTFQQELIPGTLGSGIRNLRSNWKPMGYILPFVKTPVNVLRYSHKMLPGLNLLQKEYREMLTKGNEQQQAQAMGQMAMGSIGAGMAASLAVAGNLTGGGPADFKLRKEMMSTGWQPYSFKYTSASGETTYIPLGRFDPVGMVFGMIADVVEMQKHGVPEGDVSSAALAITIALSKNFSEKTFLVNFNQTLRALTDPEQNLAKFAGGMMGNMVPGASALRGYVNDDPYLREARGVLENAKKNLPMYSETLPPQRTAFGTPRWRDISLTSKDTANAVEGEHNRIMMENDAGITPPSPSRNGVDLRDFELEDGRNAYDKLQELSSTLEDRRGRTMMDQLDKLIKSEDYQKLADGGNEKGTKLWAMSKVVQKYRQAAFKTLQKESPRLRDALTKTRRDIRSAISRNRDKPSPEEQGVNQLMDALGVRQGATQ